MVKALNIPSNLVINWDQAGVNIVPSQNWTMEERSSSHVEVAGISKRQITLTLAGTLSGELLALQLLYQGKTERSQPKFTFPLTLILGIPQTIGQMKRQPSIHQV